MPVRKAQDLTIVPAAKAGRRPVSTGLDLARVLIVSDDVASRLTLQTVLRAGGYTVDAASSAAEALAFLDDSRYQLVLCDLEGDGGEAGREVLAYARSKDYRPATAFLRSYRRAGGRLERLQRDEQVYVEPEDVPSLLSRVANLIGLRASRRVQRSLRVAATT